MNTRNQSFQHGRAKHFRTLFQWQTLVFIALIIAGGTTASADSRLRSGYNPYQGSFPSRYNESPVRSGRDQQRGAPSNNYRSPRTKWDRYYGQRNRKNKRTRAEYLQSEEYRAKRRERLQRKRERDRARR